MSGHQDLSKEQMEQLSAVFRSEGIEHVKALAGALFALEERRGEPSELLARAFREAHSLKGSAATLGFERVETLTHRLEDLLGELKQLDLAPSSELVDPLLVTLEAIRKAVIGSPPGDARLTTEEQAALTGLDRLGSRLRDSGSLPPARQSRPPSTKPPAPAETLSTGEGERSEFIRVSEARLDAVIGQVGELFETSIQLGSVRFDLAQGLELADQLAGSLTALLRRVNGTELEEEARRVVEQAQSLLAQLGASSKKFETEEHELTKLVQRSQDGLRQIRLAPISTMFVTLRSQVREIAKTAGKSVGLVLGGGEYAVDRKVLEAIEDPLVHIIRNAIDHGIEPPGERQTAGKPSKGALSITARHMGDAVELTISDDGAGIDQEKIRAALLARGVIDSDRASELSREQLFDYLFESGFSTHKDVSKLSGRGVGLDVVKSTVEGLGGEVHLRSRIGNGTSISLRLPLAMSTVRCLLVAAGGRSMAIPAANVERVVVPRAEQLRRIGGGDVIVLDDRNLPYMPLEDVLALRGDAPTERAVRPMIGVVVSFGERRFAFAVDEILEYSQLIIKPLGDLLERVPNVSGISLLATGELALVLNPADLVRSAGGAADGLARRVSEVPERSPEATTILVVDDSIATRTLEKTLLESAGFKVITAEDGYKALSKLGQTQCDLVISDVQMPNMDGIELTRTIKSRETLAHLPVILVTSLGSDADKARGLSAGADAYVVKKELSQGELVRTINQLL